MKTSKRIVSLLLVLTMLLGVFCVSAAATFENETDRDDTGVDTPDVTPTVLTITYNSNYPADSGMADHIPGTDTAAAGYKLRDCAEWGWEYPDGYTLQGWSNGTNYAVGAEIPLDGSLNFNAVWKKTSSEPVNPDLGEDEDDTDVPANAPKAPAVGTRFYGAIFVNCTDNDHDEYFSWTVDKTYTPKWNSRYQVWYITATVKNLDNYLPGYRYNYDYDYDYGYGYDCNHNRYHTCNKYCDYNCQYKYCKECDIITGLFGEYFEVSNSSPYYDRYNTYYGHKITSRDSTVTLQWRNNRWQVVDSAVLRVTCGSYNNTTSSCNSKHNHTVKYTDGVSGKVIFTDKTYTVRHNAKTPTVKEPTRDGYRFAGWSPRVSTYTDECVTYVAQWVSDNAPALTTEHVAYLKGYGKGYVRPEGKITRAEAATMLYRLLDAVSLREYYTANNSFTDVNSGDWYNDAVSTLTNAGIIKGYAGGKYNPNEAITRAELTAMLSRFVYGETVKTSNSKFNDVSTSYWAYDEIALAQELGWIKGYGGSTFNPDASITRAEVAAILNRMLDRDDCRVNDTKKFVDNPTNAWYYRDIVEASIAH